MDASLYHLHHEQEDSHWWFTARAQIVRDALERHGGLNRGDCVLDIGCGAGGFLRALADRYEVVGIDTSPLAVAYAKGRGLANVFEMRADDFPRERFDVRAALLLDVIEHVDDDVAVLRSAREIVRPGGAILVTVPAYMWLWSAHDVLNHHKRRYTEKTLRASLARAGLRVEKLTYFNTLLFPLAAARRVLDRDKGNEQACTSATVGSPLANKVLRSIFLLERPLVAHGKLPFGVSLLAVARAPT